MHVPDGFLSAPVWATLDVVSAGVVGRVAAAADRRPHDLKLAHAGFLGAFVFAVQMINFPVGPGVSGHLLGVGLLTTCVGPLMATLLMTAVLIVQALLFQDGGILAMGANVFNMAVAGVLAAEFAQRIGGSSHRKTACFMAGFLSVTVSFGLVMSELAISGVTLHGPLWLATSGFMLVNASAEGLITVAILAMLGRTYPGIQNKLRPSPAHSFAYLGAAAVLLAVVGVVWSSPLPDLLESAAQSGGFAARATTFVHSLWGDHELSGLPDAVWRKAAAGLFGLAAVFFVSLSFARLVQRPRVDGPR